MKGSRKYSDGSTNDLLQLDSVRHMAAVSKGARKIMIEIPDQLTSVFTWTVFAAACIFVLLTAACLVLMYESCDRAVDVADMTPRTARHDARELCPFKDRRRLRRHVPPSKLMALDIGTNDVHLVFVSHGEYVPWSYACSLESALRAAGNGSRVNVFVVHGVGEREPGQNEPSRVSASHKGRALVALDFITYTTLITDFADLRVSIVNCIY